MEKSGDDLLSRRASPEVSSARKGLTVVFGMGTGVTLDVIDTRWRMINDLRVEFHKKFRLKETAHFLTETM